jgi:hypothetical protein
MSTPVEIDAVQVVTDLIAERDRLRRQVAEQQEELARLRAEAERLAREQARIVAERDDYLRAVYALWPKEDVPPRTEEELDELRRTAVPFDEVIAEVDQILGAEGDGGVRG